MRPLTKTIASRTVQIWIAVRLFQIERLDVAPSRMKGILGLNQDRPSGSDKIVHRSARGLPSPSSQDQCTALKHRSKPLAGREAMNAFSKSA